MSFLCSHGEKQKRFFPLSCSIWASDLLGLDSTNVMPREQQLTFFFSLPLLALSFLCSSTILFSIKPNKYSTAWSRGYTYGCHLEVFKVPVTKDMVSEIFNMSKKKSAFDVLTLAVMAGQIFLFFSLPTKVKRLLFFFIFIFWRAGYNAGLGYLLKLQSERRGLVAWAREAGIFDKNKGNPWYDWLKVELSCKMEADYDFDVSG